MDISRIVSVVQVGGCDISVGEILWLTLGSLLPIEHCLNTTTYLSVYQFMTTVHPSYDHIIMNVSSTL